MTSMLVASGAGGESTDESSRAQVLTSSTGSSEEPSEAGAAAPEAPVVSQPVEPAEPQLKVTVRSSRESMAQSEDIDTQIRQLLDQGEINPAIELLMRTYEKAVYSMAMRLLGNSNLAMEALQQTFYDALKSIRKFRGESKVKTWLLSICSHRSLDLARKNRREDRWVVGEEAADEPESPEPAAPEALELLRDKKLLESCFRVLTPKARFALLARYQQGLSYDEIAALTGEKPGTLQARVTRALPLLRKCMEGKGDK